MDSEKVNESISDHTDIILKALDVMKSKNKGQYIENVAEFCEKEYDWDRPTTMAAIDTAKQKGAVKATMSHGKHALRVVNSKLSTNNDESAVIHEVDMLSQIQTIYQDLIDFKKFLHEEIITVKSIVTNKRTASPERDLIELYFQKSFIKSLEIGSLPWKNSHLKNKRSLINCWRIDPRFGTHLNQNRQEPRRQMNQCS